MPSRLGILRSVMTMLMPRPMLASASLPLAAVTTS